jgi:molecular chaperone IbpA
LDKLFETLEAGPSSEPGSGYPPFDIEQETPDRYRITLAVPGYSSEQLEIVAQQNILSVSGRKTDAGGDRYLHKGIAAKPFERRFMLGDYVQVRNASLADGLLILDLEREIPEAMKPRKIDISIGSA